MSDTTNCIIVSRNVFFVQVMINNVRFTFSSVSDTMQVVYNRYRARQIDLMTPNAIFSVLI